MWTGVRARLLGGSVPTKKGRRGPCRKVIIAILWQFHGYETSAVNCL
jgi:hypothetical protein